MIITYRKKPVEIQAIKLGPPMTPIDVARWCGGKVCGQGDLSQNVWIEIPTLEGTMKANYGDYIIKGIASEFYPCKSNIFEQTYEEVKYDSKP